MFGAVRSRVRWVGGWDTVLAVAVALLLGASIWQGWRFYQGDSGRILEDAATAVQSWAGGVSEFSLSGVEEEVAGLLAGARADVVARRLTSPAGNNAWEKYQEVLALVPGEPAALSGLEQVLGSYEALFEGALVGEEFDKAATYLARVREIHPDSSLAVEGAVRIEAARQRQARAEQERLAGEMVSIPGGTFSMGGNVDVFASLFGVSAKPVHRVSIPAFKLGKYEVTFAQGRMLAWRTGDAAVIPRMMKVGAGAAGRLSTFPGTMCSYSWLG